MRAPKREHNALDSADAATPPPTLSTVIAEELVEGGRDVRNQKDRMLAPDS